MSRPSNFPADRHLFCFGCGYSATRLAQRLMAAGGRVSGTTRSEAGADRLRKLGITAYVFDPASALPHGALNGVTDILCSVPPGEDGDDGVVPLLEESTLGPLPSLQWAGLLSTTGVYGDVDGAWIEEDAPLRPQNPRSRQRAQCEVRWLRWGASSATPVQVFRLPGIYGPGRSPFARLRAGKATRIIKAGQVFNRIHVDDIVAALLLGMQQPRTGSIFHLGDDEPAPADEVIAYAASLIDLPAPPAVPFEQAQLSPMARQFYTECKRISTRRVKEALGFSPRFPSYREGLAATLAEEMSDSP